MSSPVSLQPANSSPIPGVQNILDSLTEGVYVTDRERRILSWNAAAERITGWTAREVVNRTCYDNVLVHIDKDGHQLCGHEHCPLHRSIVTGAPSPYPLLVFARHKSGHRVPVEVSVAPLRAADGTVVGGIEVFRDLTEAQRDLIRARDVQRMALQCDLPADPRVGWSAIYQPSDVVGGDFYRCEQLNERCHVAMVADAMGHGMAAALHTMLLRSLWDEHRAELNSPSRLLRKFNERVFTMVRGQGYFGTAVAVVFDAATGELRCARAGHPAPLWLSRTDTKTVGEPGPGLGLLPDCEFSETVSLLAPGESVLLFSDGAEEIPAQTGTELGSAGLARLARDTMDAATGAIDLNRLEEELIKAASLVHLPDDLTLLSLHRRA